MKYGVSAFAVILAFAFGAGSPCLAKDQKISVRAMDWNDPAQVSNLYHKLDRTARAMCSSTGAPRREMMLCVDQALRDAIAESEHQELAALHAARHPASPQSIAFNTGQ